MGSTSILYQGLQSCMEPQLPEQHVLINKSCRPRLIFSQSKSNSSSKKAEAEHEQSNAINNIGGWSFIQDLSNPKKDHVEKLEMYVHPLVKRSYTTLSIKSLEMCTESLGSETGSDISESNEEHSIFLSENENSHLAQRSKCREIAKKHNRTVNFPPPLTSISGVQVRPHREDGRLILKATTISAPKSYFKTERVDGRLRLFLLNNTETETETEAEVEVEARDDNVDESDDGNRKLASENGYIRPRKCKENGSRIKGIPSWEPFWVAIS